MTLFLPLDLAVGAAGALLAHAAIASQHDMVKAKLCKPQSLPRKARYYWAVMYLNSGFRLARSELNQHGALSYERTGTEPTTHHTIARRYMDSLVDVLRGAPFNGNPHPERP